ncbi:MAG TPA: SUMF1/EgtB/PvdO family nonheme iron enzyme [Xanthobacteraceae bacterium]|nr:SUMF1/EgtB/PvdO family nonheme iron enzyme [Xanthobacteraceae bacterium]
MRRWFLSYNSQDSGLMQSLEQALRRKDPAARIFFAPTSLRPGGLWLPELAVKIADATAFVLLVGESGIGPWQAMEYYEALDRRVKQHDFPLVLVLLEGQAAPGLPFLRQLHWVITADPTSAKSLAQIMDAAAGNGAPPGEIWRHTAPYRGLYAMTESDADFFFGRGRETAEVINVLAAAPHKLPVLLGNSGVGKSSLAQAGVIAALMRQAWPETAEAAGAWPQMFNASRHWCFLKLEPDSEPVRALVEPFLWTWQFDSVDPRRAALLSRWVRRLLAGAVTLRDLLDATAARYRNELRQPEPPAFLIYIDQGEELYTRAEERARRCFSEVLAEGLTDPRLRAIMSLRADFFGDLQKDEALYSAHRQINVPPLREAQLQEVVSRPAALLSARFETPYLADSIAHLTAAESARDAGALPLLSYLLEDMWSAMVARGDGVLRLPAHAIELGTVLVDRANSFVATHPNSEDQLRRILTLKLATVRDDEEPTRRRAGRLEFSDEEWRLVSELADHPNRLLVIAASEAGETYAEVAHEAIFRRWQKLRDWIAAEREFLAWRTRLEAARRAWQATPDSSKNDALLMGAALTQAETWLARRREDLPVVDRNFIDQSAVRRTKARRRARRVQAFVYVLLAGMIIGLVGWSNQSYLKEQMNWFLVVRPYMLEQVRPYVLSAEAERALEPGATFRECAKDCPEMVVVPAGEFMMGSPPDETRRDSNEGPQHEVVLAKRFAVSKFEVTFDEWQACVTYGDCDPHVSDSGWGRGRQPVIDVPWDQARRYAAWLARMTGKPYRLLTEAEWEYAARAGTTTAFFWGNEIGKGNANCDGCGSRWDNRQTAPVGSFPANAFGLDDMSGNVAEWVEDCWHDNYDGAPTDGSAWTAGGDCSRRLVRGGAWHYQPWELRSANREWYPRDARHDHIGFRIARTLQI